MILSWIVPFTIKLRLIRALSPVQAFLGTLIYNLRIGTREDYIPVVCE